MKYRLFAMVAVAAMVLASTATTMANEFEPQIREAFKTQIQPWLGDATLVDAIKAQNAKHASLTAADIDKLDKDWRAQAKGGGGALIDQLLGTALSKFLKAKKDASNGVFSEIFAMDNKGLNVGQSDVTSDYMQGDEGKWKKTYGAGPGAVFIDEVEFDDSSQTFQSQLSTTIVDADGKAIGAITFGLNVENLP